MNLLQQYRDYIQEKNLFRGKDKLLLAVSGGVDSVALCELTRQAGYDFSIAHCNFQLRGNESDRDENFVKDLAKKYNVEFFARRFETAKVAAQQKISIQEAARKLRYEWFKEILISTTSGFSYLLTAHHADDNIETVLMNFFRGTGIKGLRGIEPKKGKIIRPLLFARRRELEKFLKDHQLEFVTDSSNLKEDYSRNYFRLSVIPLLEKIYPGVNENILDNIERFSEVVLLYEQALEFHKKNLLEYKGEEIRIPVLKLKKSKPLKSILFELANDWGFRSHQIADIINLIDSETGKYITSSTHRILKNRNWLEVTPHSIKKPGIVLIEKGEGKFAISSGQFPESYLEFETIQAPGFSIPSSEHIACFDAREIQFPVILRKWKTGDYFYPFGMKDAMTARPGKKKLSRFFIDQKLSKTEKEKVWVLEMNKRIIWVVGYRIDDRVKITGKTKTILKVTFFKNQTG